MFFKSPNVHNLSKYEIEKGKFCIQNMLIGHIAGCKISEVKKVRLKKMIINRLAFNLLQSVFRVFFLSFLAFLFLIAAKIYAIYHLRLHLFVILAFSCSGLLLGMSLLLIFIQQKRAVIKEKLGQFIDQEMNKHAK